MAAIATPQNCEDFSTEERTEKPSHFLIEIQSFSLLKENGINKYEATNEFTSGGYKWRLIIYPDGCESPKRHISVYVAMVETISLPVNWEVNAMFTIFLYKPSSKKYLGFRGNVCRFHTKKAIWGFSQMISKKRFLDPSNGYLVDDNCVFGAEVFVIKHKKQVSEHLYVQKYVDGKKNIGKHTIEILNYSQLKDVWNSEEFTIGNFKWKIQLYPNGVGEFEGKSLFIGLVRVDLASHQKVTANYCLRIRNQFNDESSICWSSTHCFESSDSWGKGLACIADMNDPEKGLVVSDRCVIETEISVQAILKEVP